MKTLIIFMICKFIFIANALQSNNYVWPLDNSAKKNCGLRVTYMAGLYEQHKLFCTGAFISPTHILTIALCLVKFFTEPYALFEDYHAQFGKWLTPYQVVLYGFQKVEIHKDYNLWNSNFHQNNVGVITVALSNPSERSDLQLSRFEISKDNLSYNYIGHVIGWGSHKRSQSDEYKELHFALFKIVSCDLNVRLERIDRFKMFCASKKWRKSYFTWDEIIDRGALFMRGKYAVGILTLPPRDNIRMDTGVFIKLENYESWLNMAMLDERDRTDEGRVFRKRESNINHDIESSHKRTRA